MTDAPELKPCPFCGGEAKIDGTSWTTRDGKDQAWATCRKCGCYGPSAHDAIAAWNTRADLAAAQGEEAVAEARSVATKPDAHCTIVEYTNYRGEMARRVIIPIRLWWGATEWHPEEQWMLTAWDVEKDASRDFAWQDMRHVANPATSAAIRAGKGER